LLGERGQADPFEVRQARGEFGVEEPGRTKAHLHQARQVLARRVQHPFSVGDRVRDLTQVTEGERVDEDRAGPVAPKLHQVGPVRVAVTGRAFGIDRHRAGSGGEQLRRAGQPGRRRHRLRSTPARCGENDGRLSRDLWSVGHMTTVR
jgi:hypothetical protein